MSDKHEELARKTVESWPAWKKAVYDRQVTEVSIADARAALNRFCQGKERMCIPVQSDDDDMVLVAAIDELEQARGEIARLRSALEGTAIVSSLAGAEIKALRERVAVLEDRRGDYIARDPESHLVNAEHKRQEVRFATEEMPPP